MFTFSVFFQFEIIINVYIKLAFSASFEYLCYHGYASSFNVQGTVFIIQNLTYKNGPRTERVKCHL